MNRYFLVSYYINNKIFTKIVELHLSERATEETFIKKIHLENIQIISWSLIEK